MGFEPTNDGFANRSVRPLRHCVLFNLKNGLTSIYISQRCGLNRRAIYISRYAREPLRHRALLLFVLQISTKSKFILAYFDQRL